MPVSVILKAVLGGMKGSLAGDVLGLARAGGVSTAAMRRILIREAVPGLMRAGFSAARTMRSLTDLRIGIGRAALRSIWRLKAPMVKAQQIIEAIKSYDVIDTSIAWNTPRHMGIGYWAQVDVFGWDVFTGEWISHPYFVEVTPGMTRSDAESEAMEEMEMYVDAGASPQFSKLSHGELVDVVYSEY